jgi:hypothetical protein
MIKSRFLPALVISSLLMLSLVGPAQAASSVDSSLEESKKRFQVGLSFGAFWLEDSDIQSVYGSKGRFMPKLSIGFVPLSKYVHIETNFTIGFLQFQGSKAFVSSGDSSADNVWMTVFPLGFDLSIGIDIAEEQPVVPYGGVGFALTLWREHESDDGDSWSGDRFGYSGFFGLAVLLDRFEPARSRRLDSSTGINDVYFSFEGRYSDVSRQVRDGEISTEGLAFGGWSFTAGLKFVY